MSTENKLGQEPAFLADTAKIVTGQTSYNYKDENGNSQIGHHNIFSEVVQNGISKRYFTACMAMQGLLSNPNILRGTTEDMSKLAFKQADAMLKQENL